jgi:hypothetical protein
MRKGRKKLGRQGWREGRDVAVGEGRGGLREGRGKGGRQGRWHGWSRLC